MRLNFPAVQYVLLDLFPLSKYSYLYPSKSVHALNLVPIESWFFLSNTLSRQQIDSMLDLQKRYSGIIESSTVNAREETSSVLNLTYKRAL